MRKKIVGLLALCLCLSLVTGCGNSHNGAKKNKPKNSPAPSAQVPSDQPQEPEEPVAPLIDEAFIEKEIHSDRGVNLEGASATDCVLRFGADKYKLPFSYKRISKRWKFNYEDYDLTEDFELDSGQKTSDNIVLYNENTDYKITVGFYNPYEAPITLEDAKIWSLTISIDGAKKHPFLRLPKNLNWKSTFVDVIGAYSDPSIQFSHDKEKKLYHFTYKEGYERYLLLDVSEEKGIISFTMKRYDL